MTYHGLPDPSLETLIERARRPATKAALEACRRKPTAETWRAAEKAAWNDVRLDTAACMWLRAQAGDPT